MLHMVECGELFLLLLGYGGNERKGAWGGGDRDCLGKTPRQEEERTPGSSADYQEYRVRKKN